MLLQIEPSSTIIGPVIAALQDNTLALVGPSGTTGSFDLAQLGPTKQYEGFDKGSKDEDGTWKLINSTSSTATPAKWSVTGGTLELDTDQLGATQFALSGGTLRYTNGLTVSNPLSVTAAAQVAVNGADAATQAGAITGEGFTKAGTGTLTLTGENTNTGTTTISAGTLQLGNGGATGSLAGPIANSGALVLERTGALSLPGVISGTGSLTQRGAGVTTLAGANTYTGATALDAGTLLVNGALANTALTLAAGTTLGGSGTLNTAVSVPAGATLAPGPAAGQAGTLSLGATTLDPGASLTYDLAQVNVVGTENDLLKVNGNLNLAGTVKINDGGDLANEPGSYRLIDYTGTLSGPGLRLGAIAPVFAGSVIQTVVPGQVNLIAVYQGVPVQFWNALGTRGLGANGGTGAWDNAQPNWSNLDATISQAYLPGLAIFAGAAGTVTLADAVTAGALQFSTDGYRLDGAGHALTLAGLPGNRQPLIRVSANARATLAAELAGSAGLRKGDAGTLVLSGTNTYTGGTTIAGGVLQLGDGGTTGTILGDVTDDATLAFNRADTATFGGVIAGVGNVVQSGPGTTVLSGNNTYTGNTTISAGTLQIGAGGTTGAIVGDIADNGVLSVNRSDTVTAPGVISGTGHLTQAGTGTTILTGANTYSGGTTIVAGTLQLGNGGATGSVVGDVLNNAALSVNRSNAVTLPGVISGTGTVTQAGTGTTTLTGASTYTGATAVDAGTLLINGALGSTPVTVAAGATLGGTGTVAGPARFAAGATLAPGPGSGGSGTLGLGPTTLAAGTDLNYQLAKLNRAAAGNDLLNVTGDLTLAGILNVNDGGDFGRLPGSYRLINYTGALTDQGLTLGTVSPLFGTRVVQTAIPGQVNLITSFPNVPVQYWDAGTTRRGGASGGTGVWDTVTPNWSDIAGVGQQTYRSGLAIFTGAAGTVTLADALGASVLQFSTDGYRVEGNGHALTLNALPAGLQPVIRVDAGATATIAAELAGRAGLHKGDAGTLVLTGANTYTGGTEIAAGTLQLGDGGTTGALLGDIDNHAALVFNRADDPTFAGVISGTGTVTQNGAGNLTLTGASPYTGATELNAGRLTVNGSVSASTVNVMNGATLAGTGTVGSLVANAGSTIAPGDVVAARAIASAPLRAAASLPVAPATLNVARDITFNPGSTYRVNITPDGRSTLLQAGGVATLNGGTVQVLPAPGVFSPANRFVILSADNGVTGTFAALDAPGLAAGYTFVMPTLAYDANTVYLIAQRNTVPFASLGLTPNERATASALDALGTGSALGRAVANLTSTQARAAFNAASGELHASVQSVILDQSSFFRDTVLNRARQAFAADSDTLAALQAQSIAVQVADASGTALPLTLSPAGLSSSGNDAGPAGIPDAGAPGTPDAAAAAGAAGAPGAAAHGPAVWAQGLGTWGHLASDGNAASVSHATAGFFAGADGPVGTHWRVGAAGGVTRSNVTIDDRASAASIDNYQFGVYSSGQYGPLGLSVGVAQAWHSIESNRSIAFPGFSDQAHARYGATTTQFFGEASYTAQLRRVALQPFAGVSYTRLNTDAFSETGGAAALRAAGNHQQITATTLGTRAAIHFDMPHAAHLTLRGSAGWRHRFGNTTPGTELAFLTGGASPFAIAGVPIAQDAAVIEAGAYAQLSPRATISLGYSGQIGKRAQDHAIKGGVTWTF